MHGDFSNVTFDAARRYSRVLQQQGRVTLDADTNEGSALLLHAIRALTRDLIGDHGGPGRAFLIEAVGAGVDVQPHDLQAHEGNYYVDGIRCEAKGPLRYTHQADHPGAPELQGGTAYLVYLDVWERWISHLQDPALREIALAGPDTAGRAQVIRQLRVMPDVDPALSADELRRAFGNRVDDELRPSNRGLLRARARYDQGDDEPCITPPEARYRGPENQLYRVELFAAADEEVQRPATFVWSRDNGSVAFAVLDLDADAGSGRTTLNLDGLHPDAQRGLAAGHWVELRDDRDDLDGTALGWPPSSADPAWARTLHRVVSVDALESRVVVEGVPGLATRFDATLHPLLRRWDQDGDPDLGGAAEIEEGWLGLEDGVEVEFVSAPDDGSQRYRPGDYWLIPARTISGDVLWPQDAHGHPEPRPPDGVTHHYAPLAAVRLGEDGVPLTGESDYRDLRLTFSPLAAP